MKLRAVLVDDEALVRDELRFLLEQTGQVEILGEAGTGEEAVALVRSLRPAVLFLDVQMPGPSGLAVAEALRAEPGAPQIVFATAYDDWAVEAFRLRAFDYLLKPFDPERVQETVQGLRERLAEALPAEQASTMLPTGLAVGAVAPRRLALNQDGRTLLLDPAEILCAVADDEGALVKTERAEYRTSLSLQALGERLPPAFLRVHRQYLVNSLRVVEFIPWPGGLASVVLDDRARSRVPVARTQVRRVKELLGID
ncbi:MAG TPA: response regulator [Symbiobacteriaceae bacterium]|nr:response regulator [Symbiobacteriaceae bacterium]